MSTNSIHMWLTEPLAAPVAKSIQQLAQTDDIQHVAVMPDVHLGREICIGTVLATERTIIPAAVGSDIGCGMAVLPFDMGAAPLADAHEAARILKRLYVSIPSNRHSQATMAAQLPDELQVSPLSESSLNKAALRDGRVQLGTLGRGNHFLEFQADEQSRLWVMVHSGSRAMGQLIYDRHTGPASSSPAGVALQADSDIGQAYLNDARWAASYARENRLALLRAVEAILILQFGATAHWEQLIQSDHNHVRLETHGGRELWVHRKGAQYAAEGIPGIIPGSMGTESYLVSGRGESRSLESCSHGAGRRMSRGEAKRKISPARFERELDGVWFDHRRTSQLCDEAPSAYKDIRKVMRAQSELVRIERRLKPILSYKGA
jgi:tRNA-splicing ligase RtcB